MILLKDIKQFCTLLGRNSFVNDHEISFFPNRKNRLELMEKAEKSIETFTGKPIIMELGLDWRASKTTIGHMPHNMVKII